MTKILGEWWADLPAHQKTSYTELARQYKEAFLRANPDFKWYKIPAQPPRPPPARPSNQKVPRCNPLPTDGAITFGKLAGVYWCWWAWHCVVGDWSGVKGEG